MIYNDEVNWSQCLIDTHDDQSMRKMGEVWKRVDSLLLEEEEEEEEFLHT